jgi:hypothetical protein
MTPSSIKRSLLLMKLASGLGAISHSWTLEAPPYSERSELTGDERPWSSPRLAPGRDTAATVVYDRRPWPL